MDLREECRGAKKIGISGHIRPDGDCVGVCLSLQMYLRKLLPEAEVTVYLQKPSEEFSYLKGYDEIQTECLEQDPFDVYFALDCSSDRLGDAEKYFQNGILYGLRAFRPGGGTAVHEEAVIRQISTETDVVGHCGIFRIRSQHRSRTCGNIVDRCLHHQFLIVLNPVITGIEVDDVSQQCEDEDPQHDTHGFY